MCARAGGCAFALTRTSACALALISACARVSAAHAHTRAFVLFFYLPTCTRTTAHVFGYAYLNLLFPCDFQVLHRLPLRGARRKAQVVPWQLKRTILTAALFLVPKPGLPAEIPQALIFSPCECSVWNPCWRRLAGKPSFRLSTPATRQ